MGYLILVGSMAFVSLVSAAWSVRSSGDERLFSGILGAVAGFLASVMLGTAMFTVVPAGHVGVPVVLGSVQDRYLTEGFHFVNPLADIVHMNARTHTYTMSAKDDEGNVKGDDAIDALSKSGMTMKMDVSVPHRLVASSAPWVYKNLGPDYDQQIVRPAISTAVREATSSFTEDEVYSTKRSQLVIAMRDHLNAQIQSIIRHYGKNVPEDIIVFPEVQLRNVILPEAVRTAINEKIATEQKIVQAMNEAKRKKVEAEGIQTFQDIVSKGITPDLLRWKGIEATLDLARSPNAKVVVIGGSKDGLPIILGNSK